jgi:Domain of unknown function (DUF1911)
MKNKRQKFIYETLYKNVRQEQIDNIGISRNNLERFEIGSLTYTSNAGFIYHNKFWLWMLDYTAGVAISELANRFCDVVDDFVTWHDIGFLFNKKLQEEYQDRFPDMKVDLESSTIYFGEQTWYADVLQFISVAILIRDIRSIKRIVFAMRGNRHIDDLYEQLIYKYVDNPLNLEGVVHEKPYQDLAEAFYEEDPEKTMALIKKYLKNWYRHQNGARWYNSHHFVMDDYAPYYGYWAFEAGAACFLLDIDDAKIDSMYYPKDLVDYGRKLREEGKYTSDTDDFKNK